MSNKIHTLHEHVNILHHLSFYNIDFQVNANVFSLSSCVFVGKVLLHAIKACKESGGIAPLILNLGT